MDVGIWQGGDGKRHLINTALIFQICAATAAIDAKNKFSKVELTGTAKSAVSTQKFEHVSFDRAGAEAYRASVLRQYYGDVWRCFQAPRPGSRAAVIEQLVRLRALGRRCSEALDAKFGRASDTNKNSLGALDNQLLAAQVVRDTGFTIVIAVSTGGAGTVGTLGVGARALIATGAIVSKAGTKVYDIRSTVTDANERNNKYGSVILGTGMDVLFSGISLGSGALSVGQSMILAATIKAPAEGIKTALDGGTGQQIAFATGFEVFAPMLEGLGSAMATKLFPRYAGKMAEMPLTEAAHSLLGASQHVGGQLLGQSAAVAKDGWILPMLGQTTQGTSAASRLLDRISVFAAINGSESDYFKQCVIRAVD